MSERASLCECGHPFVGNHRTPGTECSVLGCDCGRFNAAPSLSEFRDIGPAEPWFCNCQESYGSVLLPESWRQCPSCRAIAPWTELLLQARCPGCGWREADCNCVARAANEDDWRGVYPAMCINPETCRGYSHCPRQYSCSE